MRRVEGSCLGMLIHRAKQQILENLNMMPTAATAQMMNDLLDKKISEEQVLGWLEIPESTLEHQEKVVADLQENIFEFLTFSTARDLMKLIGMTL